jgi:putative transposase
MGHPARLLPDASPGVRHVLVTICTRDRHPHFTDADVVDLICTHFLRCCNDWAFDIVAYCFMPDHLHALLKGCCGDGIAADLLRNVKQRTSFHFRRAYGRRLWQRSYFDRTLRTKDEVRTAINYVVSNPIRAGLVVSAMDYPYWGSGVYSRAAIIEFLQIGPT